MAGSALGEVEEKDLQTQDMAHRLSLAASEEDHLRTRLNSLSLEKEAIEREHKLEMELEKESFHHILTSTTEEYEAKILRMEDERKELGLELERMKNAIEHERHVVQQNRALNDRLEQHNKEQRDIAKLEEDYMKKDALAENLHIELNVMRIEHDEAMQLKTEENSVLRAQIEELEERYETIQRELEGEICNRRLDRSKGLTDYEQIQDKLRIVVEDLNNSKRECRRKQELVDKAYREHKATLTELSRLESKYNSTQMECDAAKKTLKELRDVNTDLKSSSHIQREELDFKTKEIDRHIATIKELQKTHDILQHTMSRRQDENKTLRDNYEHANARATHEQDSSEQLRVQLEGKEQEIDTLTKRLTEAENSVTQYVTKAKWYKELSDQGEATVRALESQIEFQKAELANAKQELGLIDSNLGTGQRDPLGGSYDIHMLHSQLENVLFDKLTYNPASHKKGSTSRLAVSELMGLISGRCDEIHRVLHTLKSFASNIAALVWDHDQDDNETVASESEMTEASSLYNDDQFMQNQASSELKNRLHGLLKHVRSIFNSSLKKGEKIDILRSRTHELEERCYNLKDMSDDSFTSFLVATRNGLMREVFAVYQLSERATKQTNSLAKSIVRSQSKHQTSTTHDHYQELQPIQRLLADISDKLVWVIGNCVHPSEKKEQMGTVRTKHKSDKERYFEEVNQLAGIQVVQQPQLPDSPTTVSQQLGRYGQQHHKRSHTPSSLHSYEGGNHYGHTTQPRPHHDRESSAGSTVGSSQVSIRWVTGSNQDATKRSKKKPQQAKPAFSKSYDQLQHTRPF
eukprot:TRINITY_DN63428_c0_g1_i1.p1 TRINITY_DN63428_c0_g1~~TRINITY_DN63428_c0_g1_i1.p1  ORF type:complete len:834 (+),score=88.36 TRINITY_DN63428_c0_g1_i1:82-2502(+)